MKKLFYVAFAATLVTPAFAQNLYSNQSSNPNLAALNFALTTRSGVASPIGGRWSEVQANGSGPQPESNTSAGASVNLPTFRLADDFTVTGGGWNLTGIRVYAYQTGATGDPIAGGTMNIWSGRPGDGGSSIIGTATYAGNTDMIQVDAGGTMANVFRIFNTNSPPPGSLQGTTRRVREARFTLNQTLGAGTYWIDYGFTLATGTTLFAPNTTHQDMRGVVGANARQLNGTLWGDVIDAGNPGTAADVAQDMPFIISGTPVPEPATMIALGIGAAALIRRRRAR